MIRAVVPVKSLGDAKSRLAEVLAPAERRDLALAMLEDVLAALAATPAIGRALVVSGDAAALALAERCGALTLRDAAGDLNGALVQASAHLAADALLVLPGDVPLATPAEIGELVGVAAQTAVARSMDDGTNGLLLRRPAGFRFQFGVASAARHLAEGRRDGGSAREIWLPRLARDIDDPDDLLALDALGGGTRSHALLRRIGATVRLAVV